MPFSQAGENSSVTASLIPLPQPKLQSLPVPEDFSVNYTRRNSRRSTDSRRERAERAARVSCDVLELYNSQKLEIEALRNELHAERTRADDADRDLKEVVVRFKALYQEKVAAVQEAAKAKQELQLHKNALEMAQVEIANAQELLKAVERQRNQAEEDAQEIRAIAHKLHLEKEILKATEEGRQRGFVEGIQRARLFAQDATRSSEDDSDRSESSSSSTSIYDDLRYQSSSRQQSSSNFPGPSTKQPSPPIPFPLPEPAQPSELVDATQVHPAMPSPQPYVDVPPEGFIPETSRDSVIRLPSPHELAPRPPTPGTAFVPPLPVIPEDSEEPVVVPLPGFVAGPTPAPLPEPMILRRRSQDSTPTAISELDILSSKRHGPGGSIYQVPPPHPTQNIYLQSSHTPLNIPVSSWAAGFDPDSPTRKTLSLEDDDDNDEEDQSESGSEGGTFTFDFRSPSRSPSGSPPDAQSEGNFLSADDALRSSPIPPPAQVFPPILVSHGTTLSNVASRSSTPQPLSPPHSVSRSATPVIDLPGTGLPPGFIPQSKTPIINNPQPVSDLPPGFVAQTFTPLPSSFAPLPSGSTQTYRNMPGDYGDRSNTPRPNSGPVIPSPELMRRAEEDDSSSSMSGETLTTPRPKKYKSKSELSSTFSSYIDGGAPVRPPSSTGRSSRSSRKGPMF
ncbi:uncharacterized protein BT62DRAFT_741482 [Guyanagaster necrorhizus]|uniref:Uncharacterized protein n=1 Tax=Guyanagaster necrorhizus TaxID=856835 RepID=A0A9P7VWT9_9AGAR|nr:uncharacterized protein BT62DRAFT_741482 [Guyanagaster necrorhizus MCA 3950]KAG7447900.1 hypothetical protein BT62DRAFT_741482 [Guyanagaster necrorhizus MCA 3950]